MSAQVMWIKCDIDGTGRKWRLAITRGDRVYFPLDDFEDCVDSYLKYPTVPVEKPT